MKTLLLHCNINEQLFDEHKFIIGFVMTRYFEMHNVLPKVCKMY